MAQDLKALPSGGLSGPSQQTNDVAALTEEVPQPNAAINERISLPFALRAPIAIAATSFVGFAMGVSHGSVEAGMRFRAENTHRLPTTQTGWYLYHKSKNYHVTLGGVREGIRMALRQSLWVGCFFSMEEGVDRFRAGLTRRWMSVRGRDYDNDEAAGDTVLASKDFISSLLAGLGTAGAFSAWNRFSIPTAARLARTGAKVGLVFGIMQDGVSLARGRRIGYVEVVKRLIGGRRGHDDGVKVAAVD